MFYGQVLQNYKSGSEMHLMEELDKCLADGMDGYLLHAWILHARRYASTGTSYGHVSICVCHKLEFCRNGWTNRSGFGMRASSTHPTLDTFSIW